MTNWQYPANWQYPRKRRWKRALGNNALVASVVSAIVAGVISFYVAHWQSQDVTRKGGAHDVIIWKSRTARLISNYLAGRTSGPLFVTSRGAKSDGLLGPGDRDEHGRARLCYERAEELFKEASGGKTLHQLRHSGLTHDAEDGASLPMLMTKSGHESIRSLGKYARPGTEALARWQQETDPMRRGR